MGERAGEALGEVWVALGATPLALASLVGGFLPLALGGDTFPLLGRDLAPPPFTMVAGGGVRGLRGRFLGAV